MHGSHALERADHARRPQQAVQITGPCHRRTDKLALTISIGDSSARQRLTSDEYDTTVAAGENEDATGVQGGATGAEAGTEPSESQGHGHGGGMAGVGAALPPGRHPKHGDG